jgi:multimeric flavodoxin WrbA
MKIVVLGGSPKGENGLTHLYVRFLRSRFPQHHWTLWEVSSKNSELEYDDARFTECIDAVRNADGVLWAFPVYFYLVPGPYKRFIELIFERGVENAFRDRYAAVLTTSIRFFDHTAHNYLHGICDDLDMRYSGFHSAAMDDILRKMEQQRLLDFGRNFLSTMERQVPTSQAYSALSERDFQYRPGLAGDHVDTMGKRLVIVTDLEYEESNLGGMISRFKAAFSETPEVVNLREVAIAGGCVGCVQCGYENICVYRDGFREMFTEQLQIADIIVFAGSIKDRYLSSLWKTFFDRSFFNNHVPAFAGKQFGFIISGPLAQLANLRQILQAYTEIQQANPAGFVTDEFGDSSEIDALLQNLAAEMVRLSEAGSIRTPTYLSVGGKKLFRDVVWGQFRHIFPADHRHYQRHGFYDFPQKNYGMRVMNGILYPFTRSRSMRMKTIEKLQGLRKKQILDIIGDQDGSEE